MNSHKKRIINIQTIQMKD